MTRVARVARKVHEQATTWSEMSAGLRAEQHGDAKKELVKVVCVRVRSHFSEVRQVPLL